MATAKHPTRTQADLANERGCSVANISQTERRALEKFRQEVNRRGGLKNYLLNPNVPVKP